MSNKIQMVDLKGQYLKIKDEVDAGIHRVIDNTAFINGPIVKEFAQHLSEYQGGCHVITCANGTDALTLALMAWGVGAGDAVFGPDFTFFSSGEVVAAVGATPVFVDVRQDTYNINVLSLETQIKNVNSE